MGSVVFAIIGVFYFKVINQAGGTAMINMTQISVVHTIYNVLNTLLLFPFAGGLVFLVEKIIRGKIKRWIPLKVKRAIIKLISSN